MTGREQVPDTMREMAGFTEPEDTDRLYSLTDWLRNKHPEVYAEWREVMLDAAREQ